VAHSGGQRAGARLSAPETRSGLNRRLYSLIPTVLALLVVLGTFFIVAIASREAAISNAQDRMASLATMLAEHAGRLLDATSPALGEVAQIPAGRDWDDVAQSGADYQRLKQLSDRMGYLQSFQLTGETGMPRLTGRSFPAPSIPSGDREYFLRAKAGAPGLLLSTLVRSRVTGQANIVLAQRLAGANDAFRGIAQAVIDPGYFFQFYEQIARETGAEIMLIRDDGAVVLRHPPVDEDVALTLRFLDVASAASYVSPADQTARIGAVRPVRGYPLLAGVGIERSRVLAAWGYSVLLQGAYDAAALAAILILGLAVYRRAEHDRQLAADLERRVAERTIRLREAVDARDLMLRELNHRVKNNFQLVASRLRLQGGRSLEPKAKELIEQTIQGITVLADVHANLYQGARSNWLDVAVYLGDLCQRLYSSYFEPAAGSVNMQVVVEPCWLDIDRAIPLGLIVNELVTNAVKHGFEDGEGGTVRVQFQPASDAVWRLEVIDDPTPRGRRVKLADEPAPGLGMQLVQAFAHQLGGPLHIEHSPQYRVFIDLPWSADDTKMAVA
jgi:two-component sensor histidine kinase